MKEPIKPEDIQQGDLIRWERGESEGAEEYRSWRVPHPPHRGVGNYYLLDRPETPVHLPTKPTLGWLSWQAVDADGKGEGFSRRLGIYEPIHDGITDNAAAGMWPACEITAFTPAVAVPEESLMRLYDLLDLLDLHHWTDEADLIGAVREFLDDTIEANGGSL